MIKIMPLGDSITAGVEFINDKRTCENGGYRTYLWRKAQTDGLGIGFVGSQRDGPSDIARGHEGHPGWKTSQLIKNVERWLREYSPHISLLMTGTNDLISDQDADIAVQRLDDLMGRMFRIQPELYLAVASVPPLKWSISRGHMEPLVISYNSGISNLVETYAAKGKVVRFVDVYGAMEEDHLLGTHPSLPGYEKIAEIWYPVLKSLYYSALQNGSRRKK